MSERSGVGRLISRPLSRRRLIQGASIGGGLALTSAACSTNKKQGTSPNGPAASSDPTAKEPKRGGALTSYLGLSPLEGFEPYGPQASSAALPLFALIYNGLLRVKLGDGYKFADRAVEGALASKWEQPDSQTLTFTLRPGVKFHNKPPLNGRQLTSEDVKFTFDRTLASAFSYLGFFNGIASVETPNPQTVVFKTKAPDATLIPHLALGFASIIAKEAAQPDPKGAAGLSFKDPSTAIGTGPYMLDIYQQGSRESFVRNPDYFESGLPYLDRIDIQIIPDLSSQVAALRSGQAMVATVPSGNEAELRTTNAKLVYSSAYSQSAWYRGMRTDAPPFSDVRVRRAVAMAFNRGNISKLLGTPDAPDTFGSVTAITGDAWLPLDKLGQNAQWWKPDLAAAKQLLSAAGYANGFETTLNESDCCGNRTLPEAFAADMAKIGIKVNLRVQPHASYVATSYHGNYDGMVSSQVPTWDADDWLSSLLPRSTLNESHVDDPIVNDLVPKQRAELDPQKRLDIIHQLVQHLAGQVYRVTQPQIISTDASQPFVKNYALRVGYQPTYLVTWLDR